MKQIQAYIKPHKLDDVVMALKKLDGLRGMTVIDVRGFGRRSAKEQSYSVVDELIDFAKYVKIEVFCNDDLTDAVIETIDKSAYAGLRGDGKIYVSDVLNAVKIGMGEI
jgi:nitrogen regulatory protein PII